MLTKQERYRLDSVDNSMTFRLKNHLATSFTKYTDYIRYLKTIKEPQSLSKDALQWVKEDWEQ